MKAPNQIEQEINRIRLHIYEETKNMTPEQRAAYYAQSAQETAKQYGFRVVEQLPRRKTGPAVVRSA